METCFFWRVSRISLTESNVWAPFPNKLPSYFNWIFFHIFARILIYLDKKKEGSFKFFFSFDFPGAGCLRDKGKLFESQFSHFLGIKKKRRGKKKGEPRWKCKAALQSSEKFSSNHSGGNRGDTFLEGNYGCYSGGGGLLIKWSRRGGGNMIFENF